MNCTNINLKKSKLGYLLLMYVLLNAWLNIIYSMMDWLMGSTTRPRINLTQNLIDKGPNFIFKFM